MLPAGATGPIGPQGPQDDAGPAGNNGFSGLERIVQAYVLSPSEQNTYISIYVPCPAGKVAIGGGFFNSGLRADLVFFGSGPEDTTWGAPFRQADRLLDQRHGLCTVR
ncbi:hypothetical protein BH23GEM9_BH23GEM9_12770 [soil metagenome]